MVILVTELPASQALDEAIVTPLVSMRWGEHKMDDVIDVVVRKILVKSQ